MIIKHYQRAHFNSYSKAEVFLWTLQQEMKILVRHRVKTLTNLKHYRLLSATQD